MFESFKAGRINKITATHSEPVSDALILMNIVNGFDAKKALTPTEFQSFMGQFNIIKQRKDERLTNSLQYEQRAFAIAYEIEDEAGVPYDKVCGDATEILYMYSIRRPQFEDFVNDIFNEYEAIIENIKKVNGVDELKLYCLAGKFFTKLSLEVLNSDSRLFENIITCFAFEMASKKWTRLLVKKFNIADDPKQMEVFKDSNTKMNAMAQMAYDNSDTIELYIENYARSFLYFAGAEGDDANCDRIVSMANRWRKL